MGLDLDAVYGETRLKLYSSLVAVVNNILNTTDVPGEIKNKMIGGAIDGIISSFVSLQSLIITDNKKNLVECYDEIDYITNHISCSLREAIIARIKNKSGKDKPEGVTKH